MSRATGVIAGMAGSLVTVWVIGFVLGIVLAVVGDLKDPVFLTSTWSYVPSEQFLLHGAMVGASLVLALGAFQFAVLMAMLLLRHGMLIGSVGAGMSLSGMLMLILALRGSGLDDGQRLMFYAMGPCLSGFGLFMVWADVFPSKKKKRNIRQ